MDSFIYILERLQETHGLDARMFTINYRLIPEYPWPHGQDDCVKAYRYLLDLGVKPSRIIMAGDSAGANLVSTSTLAIRDQKLPLPHGHVLISPWVTLEADSPTFTTNAATDCIARDLVAIKGPEAYLPQLKLLDDKARQRLLQNPRISPLYANLKGICPTLVSYGGLEIFQHDIEAFVRRLKENHVDVEVLTRPDVPHIWVIEALMSPSYSIWEEDCGRIVDWCANRVK
ncbi:hypothetical protein DFQ30_006341 [Apophysomyces sp. BC1015]|nr:hypothetical protein DFQ30_006341 [Apophysomyces sp. BC1015]